jgi:hypothetical protein
LPSLEEAVKGFDAGEEYVIVEPAELEEIAPGRSRSLEISGPPAFLSPLISLLIVAGVRAAPADRRILLRLPPA